MTSFVEYVQKLQAVGFSKVTVVNPSFAPVGASAQEHVASAGYKDSEDNDVNENEELNADWSTKTTFWFYKTKFNIIQKSGAHLVGKSGKTKEVMVAKKWKDHCFVVAVGPVKAMGSKDKDAKGFPNPPGAYNTACKALFDDVDEDQD